MAIVDYINLGTELQIIVADANPSTSGIDAPLGSLIVLNDGTASFFKSGSGTTNWSQSLLGIGTSNTISKFTGSGVIGNSSITDDGSSVIISPGVNFTINSFLSTPVVGASSGTSIISNSGFTLAGASATLESNFKINPTTYTIGVGNNAVAAAISTRTITEAASGTHNLVSQLAIQALTLSGGVANTTNGATVYIDGPALLSGGAIIGSNYSLWIDSGNTRLDGQLLLTSYTSPTAQSGTPVAALMTNSSGTVLTEPPVLQETSLTINTITVQGAFTTPITLVPAQGAGTVIVPIAFMFKLNFATAAFATNTNYQFQIGTTAVSTSRSFASASSIYTMDYPVAVISSATANLANQALVWKVLTGNPTGGGTSTISIGCVYTVMTI